MLPFTEDQFFALFGRYNEAIWPLQLAAYALGAAAVGVILRSRRFGSRVALSALALLWVWTGVSYHWVFFSSINPIARAFAVLFVAQALIFAFAAMRRRIQFAIAGGAAFVAWSFIAYAAIVYPLLNALLGHAYPRSPTFGVTPCPLVIFTLGVLLMSQLRVSSVVFAIPVVWAVIGGSAALLLNVLPDLALPAAALMAVLLNARKPTADAPSHAPP
jgi:hypothetical protein